MLKIKQTIRKFNNILNEISLANSNITDVFSRLKQLERQFNLKQINSITFARLKNEILLNKTKDQVLNSYNNYLTHLKSQLKNLNSKILKIVYEDNSFESLQYSKERVTKKPTKELPPLSSLDTTDLDIAIAKSEIKKEQKIIEKKILNEYKKRLPFAPKPPTKEEIIIPKPVQLNFFKRLAYALQAKDKPWTNNNNVKLGGILSKEFVEYIFKGTENKNKDEKKMEFGKTKILTSILSYENKRGPDELASKQDVLDPYLLEKQIKELKNIISKKKPEIYKANSLGYLANITVRKMSIYFIEKYPEFFKKIYQSVRFANIKVLANTYINILFLITIALTILSFPIFIIFFAFTGGNFIFVLLKTLFGSLFIGTVTFILGTYYPNMRAKTRRTSINTNLPFAIDHMSSVISSGVSPAVMFKLISNSREYGEISIEIEKVTNYIDFFGYDILTALKAVALITPSQQFKEFMDGFVSTIETGGDLKQYLSQKSSEALLNYRLERQKYVESLGTYSDIYTGVLIAAPLFFVTALSLVSVLGGDIGGVSVNTIMTLGTYLVIPAMNILFIIFLELNQPEI
jgi:pilus assembly protein TadC